MSVDKATVERELREAWAEIVALVDSIPAQELEAPGVVEDWSVKDLLGHMAFWSGKAAADLRALATGKPEEIATPGTNEELNEWNAREAAARRGKSLSELRGEWEKSYEEALAMLRQTPPDLLGTEIKGWAQLNRFLEDTTLHYKEHAEHFRAWKRRVETTEA
jgi:uncharacterized protein (TIGR03083 family)